MGVDVLPTITGAAGNEGQAVENVADQIRVVAVDPRVDHGNRDALTLADLVRPGHVQKGQVPLRVANIVRQCRLGWDEHGQRQADQGNDDYPDTPVHECGRRIGPGSWVGSGPGSSTGGTPRGCGQCSLVS